MPSLRQLKCTIEIGPKNIVLKEYDTKIGDGYVECFVAVPSQPVPFNIHLTSTGYIAPGLAMFVFMDGVPQCNRNRRGLIIPDKTTDPEQTEVEFRVRQKEDKLGEGKWIGREWTFAQLNTIAADAAPNTSHDVLHSIGTIEVVVLRCQDGPNTTGNYSIPDKRMTAGKAAKISDSKNAIDNTAFRSFDGASDDTKKEALQVFGLDGGWDNDPSDHPSDEFPTYPDSPAKVDGPSDKSRGHIVINQFPSGDAQPGASKYPQGPPQGSYAAPMGLMPPFPQGVQYPPPPWMTSGYQPYVGPYPPQWMGQGWATVPQQQPGKTQQWAPMWPGVASTKAGSQHSQQQTNQSQKHQSPWGAGSGVHKDGKTTMSSKNGGKAGSVHDSAKEDKAASVGGWAADDTKDESQNVNWGATGDTNTNTWPATGDAPQQEASWPAQEAESKSRKTKTRKSKDEGLVGNPVDPERPYVKTYWSGGSRTSKSGGENDKKDKKNNDSNRLYLVSEEPLLQVPSKLAEENNMSHQVQAGKGAIYYHRTGRPKYIDTMKNPYAVFTFKYRSKEMLQKILSVEVKEDKEDYRQRMRQLTKEEIIAQLMIAKNLAGYSENSSINSDDQYSSKDEDEDKSSASKPSMKGDKKSSTSKASKKAGGKSTSGGNSWENQTSANAWPVENTGNGGDKPKTSKVSGRTSTKKKEEKTEQKKDDGEPPAPKGGW